MFNTNTPLLPHFYTTRCRFLYFVPLWIYIDIMILMIYLGVQNYFLFWKSRLSEGITLS